MPRKGRDLEKLIGILESSLQGTDVTVTSPDIIPGIISKVSREVDVTLRAPDGSLTAFECRNWTDTKQGVAWIEQLASKKKDLGVQRVFAVSSSDFSEGARNLALHFGVELRTLDDLTFADIANWAPMNIPLVIHRGEFKQVLSTTEKCTKNTDRKVYHFLNPKRPSSRRRGPSHRNKGCGKPASHHLLAP